MRSVAALLAAVLALAAGGCGGDGAEPGASREATLMLDFTPNAAHAGIYAALEQGDFSAAGLDLSVRTPGDSTDAPKLLAAGRVDLAVLDINDLAIARARGFDLVAIFPVVRAPLGAVIARDRAVVRRPRDLEGGRVGVTGLPSDDAVLDAVMRADGADPDTVERINIGFDSVAALSAERIDAATAFWNAEGVVLRELGVPTREFRVDEYVSAAFPELVLAVRAETLRTEPSLAADAVAAMETGTSRVARTPEIGLDALAARVPETDKPSARRQLDALTAERVFGFEFDRFRGLGAWARFASEGGIVSPAEARETVRNGFRNPGAATAQEP
jgi:NitT/TauT family transport system substrate-binding protein/putative hydroxymethylpyrimidine transport system substrate-binding protein